MKDTLKRIKDFAVAQIPLSITRKYYSSIPSEKRTTREGKVEAVLDSLTVGLVFNSHYIFGRMYYNMHDDTLSSLDIILGTGLAVYSAFMSLSRDTMYKSLSREPDSDRGPDNDDGGDFPEPDAPPEAERYTDYYWESRMNNKRKEAVPRTNLDVRASFFDGQ